MSVNFDCSGHLCFVGSKTHTQAQAQVPEITFVILFKAHCHLYRYRTWYANGQYSDTYTSDEQMIQDVSKKVISGQLIQIVNTSPEVNISLLLYGGDVVSPIPPPIKMGRRSPMAST